MAANGDRRSLSVFSASSRSECILSIISESKDSSISSPPSSSFISPSAGAVDGRAEAVMLLDIV